MAWAEDEEVDVTGDMEEGQPELELEQRLQEATSEREICREGGDTAGEAGWLLELAEVYSQGEAYAEALAAAEEAQTLYQGLGDSYGQAAALQAAAQVHIWDSKLEEALDVALQAVPLSKAAEDAGQEAGLHLLIAQVHMQMHAAPGEVAGTPAALQKARMAADAATRAVNLARKADEYPILAYALCELAQACTAATRTQEAAQAAGEAVGVYRSIGDRQGEAYALLAGSKACIAAGKQQRGWEAAGEALLLFRELGDAEGQELAEAAIDSTAADGTATEPWLMDRSQQMRLALQKHPSAGAAQPVADGAPTTALSAEELDELKGKVRETVNEIAGIDDIVDDSPLMNMGLTSQSAVLLRNSLSKQFPGSSLPYTMMFDFPSISAITDFFVRRQK